MSQFNLIGFSNSGANVFNNLTISETGAMVLPYGVSSERPVSPVGGMLRYNTTDTGLEYYNETSWLPVVATDNLEDTLIAGNNAGANDIDMNNQDILNVNDIALTTVNGSPYPPALGNLVLNDQTASYTLVATDNNKRVIMNSASDTTITVDDLVLDTGDSVFIANKGLGKTTITAGSGVSIGSSSGVKLEQFRSALLLAFSASNFSLFLSAGAVPLDATGGTISFANIGGTSFKIHTYDVVGTFSFHVFMGSANVEYLVIGGGGGGGLPYGGGGGAGSVLENILFVVPDTYQIVVGAGGAGRSPNGTSQTGGSGNNSSAFGENAIGGGGGGPWDTIAGVSGGSGGGGGASNTSTTGALGGSGTSGEGNAGGSGGQFNTFGGGGGGGRGSAGSKSTSALVSGAGGQGHTSSINGISTVRAGGGAGGIGMSSGTYSSGSVQGGAGEGGYSVGSSIDQNGQNAVDNTGSGGGGGGGVGLGYTSTGNSGAGGSGIVIIRYQI